MEFIRIAKKVGNSAGVILPKKILGSEVKITVISRPLNVKKEILKVLDSYLKDIMGIYVISKNPTEVLAISHETRRLIQSERIKLIVIPFFHLKKDLKTNISLRKKIDSAETILNKSLLSQLRTRKL